MKRSKKDEYIIEKVYRETCNGIEINIMDISKIYAEGRRLIAEGADYDLLRIGIRAFVETIRQN